LKIGIDAFGCDHGRSGFGSYILSLVHNLPDSGFDVELFGPELDRYTYTSGVDNVTYSGISIPDNFFAERLWHTAGFPSFVRKQKYNAILFPAGIRLLPFSFAVPSAVLVQDILSNAYRNTDDELMDGYLKSRLKKASCIIAASRCIRDDLINMKIPESRIRVIHHGIDTDLFYPRLQPDGEAVLIHPFSIRRPYILYASRIAYPSKNHVELIKAFTLFKEKTGAPHRLVLAGADGLNAEVVHREVLKSSVSSDILLTGYFPHQSLPELYSAADACVVPSSVEGVGIPVLEAMACGVPVACARAGALPEIAGDCAVFFDHSSPAEIAGAIEKVVRLPGVDNTAFRNDLIAKGLSWSKNYSWKHSAEETLDCLVSIV